ncbi:site-2 protease family protein [Streptomyces sp. NBS 14/10]|uniref:site-2 protease family protein n=1 Tax=Streptomyces sp. NBS 14/10 TaxID=1945643 RepID=UPI000B7F1A5B|nr:site-2 protease family protein [Streptomyces sp. NBS 14/10]KAK1180274.1 site-2 protease family protein [Streptomyces sp. NBS 14/10]NUS85211.1 site-2 protease family protein [Streptomyces sp.]
MNGSMRVGHVLGVPLRMHWSVPVLVALLAYGLGHETLPAWTPGHSNVVYAAASVIGAALLMGSLLLHEAAHAVTARRKGVSVEDVTLWALGGMTKMGRPRTAGVALLVAVSGPITSLVIGGAAIGAGIGAHGLIGWGIPAALLLWLGWANLLLGVFNLLPAAPLDGGRVVQAVMWWRTGDRERAERAAGRSGQIFGMAMIAFGWVAFIRGATGGLWFSLIGLFMVIIANAERQHATLTETLRGVRVADAMSHPVAAGADWLTVDRFIDEVAAPARHSVLPVLDFEGRPSGLVSLRGLAAVPSGNRGMQRVRDVATPLSRCTLAVPGDLLNEVMDRGARPGGGMPILVVDHGHLEGIVTAHDVTRLFQLHALDATAAPPKSSPL